jgi:hypothetical protein
MNATWESILDQFLTGEGSRADVESLRLRVNLAPEERDEVEATLRLVDELAGAGNTIVVPQGALERVIASMRKHVARDTSHFSMPRWEWDGSGYRSDPMLLHPTPSMNDEEIASALIEGSSVPADIARSAASEASDDSRQQLEEFQKIIETLGDPTGRPAIPPGAEDRLTARLRERMRDADEVDPSVARRILRQLQSCPLPSLFSENLPDVLAATTDPDPEFTSPKPPEKTT